MKVTAHNLGKRFNREWVFRNFNYEFAPGKTFAITGSNGSGKSTLLQILWGQMLPSEGQINYSDRDAATLYHSVGIATPYMDLIDEFTFDEMIRFHFKFKKPRIPVESIIEKTELISSRHKVISTFSSGMRQRLKLTLALYAEVDLLFLDEPCTNLDRPSIAWYHRNLEALPPSVTVFIASNQEHEYPAKSEILNILNYK
ncbi:MAG: ATP-binding cassette domain-containing protein [Bacteroidetes bacterium]|nr:ATP-binding cassette domain-containing protein [Bacteroidota bacterium]